MKCDFDIYNCKVSSRDKHSAQLLLNLQKLCWNYSGTTEELKVIEEHLTYLFYKGYITKEQYLEIRSNFDD